MSCSSHSPPCQVAEASAFAPARASNRLSADDRRDLEARAAGFGPAALGDNEVLQLVCGLDGSVADRLLADFGSLPEVYGAGAVDIARVAGKTAALRLRLVQELAGRVLRQPLCARAVISSSTALDAYLRAALLGAPREQFRVLFLDKRNHLIRDETLGDGTVDHAPVYPREVARRALELHASAVILVHNHPSGDATPSSADVDMTRQVVDALRALRIAVHDHILVAGQTTASFRALGLM